MNVISETFKGKALVRSWTYRGPDGATLGVVGRYEDGTSRKEVVPHFKRNGSGWLPGGPEEPAALFGLNVLAGNPDDPVFIVEGERCAASLQSMGLPSVTSPGGSEAAHKADWVPLSGRKKVYLLRDNDTPGVHYMQAVVGCLAALPDPPEVLVVDLPDLPDKGGDVVDFLQARCPGWDGFSPVPESERKRLVGDLQRVGLKARPVPSDWTTQKTGEWADPVPLPDLRPSVPAFDAALLPDVVRPWMTDIAERMQCPPEFPAVSAMVAIASLVGRQVGIRPKKYDDWLVVPNLWGAVVGRPGIMKTPAVEEAMNPLRRLKDAATTQHKLDTEAHESDEAIHEAMLEAAKKALKAEAGKQVVSIDAFSGATGKLAERAEVLRRLKGEAPGAPVLRRYLTNNSSYEKLGELLSENHNGMMLYRDELASWIRGLDKDGSEEGRGFYLEGWNGTGSYTFDRIVRGTVHIEAMCISMLGGIQPGPLSEYVYQATHNGAGNDGLLQRFQLLVWPDTSGDWRNVDRWPDTQAKNAATAVFDRLDNIDVQALGADTSGDIPFLRFAPEAQAMFDLWRTDLEQVKLRSGEPEPLEAHLAKYRSLAPSLALLFHLIDDVKGPVSVLAAARAFEWCDYLEQHARRVYGVASIQGLDAAHALADKIKSGKVPAEFKQQDIYLKGWARLDKEGTEKALSVLSDCNWLSVRTRPSGPKGGRPSKTVTLNPALGVRNA